MSVRVLEVPTLCGQKLFQAQSFPISGRNIKDISNKSATIGLGLSTVFNLGLLGYFKKSTNSHTPLVSRTLEIETQKFKNFFKVLSRKNQSQKLHQKLIFNSFGRAKFNKIGPVIVRQSLHSQNGRTIHPQWGGKSGSKIQVSAESSIFNIF